MMRLICSQCFNLFSCKDDVCVCECVSIVFRRFLLIELRARVSSSIRLVVIPVSYVQAMCELAVKFVVPSDQSILSL